MLFITHNSLHRRNNNVLLVDGQRYEYGNRLQRLHVACIMHKNDNMLQHCVPQKANFGSNVFQIHSFKPEIAKQKISQMLITKSYIIINGGIVVIWSCNLLCLVFLLRLLSKVQVHAYSILRNPISVSWHVLVWCCNNAYILFVLLYIQ